MTSYAYYQSPIGLLQISASPFGLLAVQRVKKNQPRHAEGTGLVQKCKSQLGEYFEGERQEFDLTFDWEGHGEFQQKVWKELLKIPYGRTTSYGAIAEKLGDSNASRAVGMANRHNPIAIIVPCHRVIAKNGELQGYFYGLDTKRFLLQLENPKSFALQGSLF